VLQTLLILLRSKPQFGHKCLVIGTSSDLGFITGLRMKAQFDHFYELPKITGGEFKNVVNQALERDEQMDISELDGAGIGEITNKVQM